MPSSGSCGGSTRGVIFNFGYLGTNKKRSTDPDLSCCKYPIPDDTPLPFGHRKIGPDQQVRKRRRAAVTGPCPAAAGPLPGGATLVLINRVDLPDDPLLAL